MGIKLVNNPANLKLTQGMLKGDDGASAYEIALAHGFEGTEEEWLASLKGEPGAPGEAFEFEDFTAEQLEALKGKDGEPGKDGYTPIKGVDYFDGEPGKDGVDGKTPVKGVDYFDGQDGAPGKDGYTPVKGVDYFDGAPGKDGVDGKDGEKGDPFTYEDFTEEQLAALKGADGKDGADGESGVYVGTTEPTDDSLIWINPTEAGAALATQEYVDSAIAAAIGVIENGTY